MPVHFIDLPERRTALLVLPDPGRRRLRFLFSYKDELRAMCWMTVGSHGSLYLNPRVASTTASQGEGVADGRGGFTDFQWNETRALEPGGEQLKLSYHASGVVKLGDLRSRSVSVREITESTLIRQDDYAHPNGFDVLQPDALRDTDFVVPMSGGRAFVIDDARPLTSRVYVAPLRSGNASVRIIEGKESESVGQAAIVVPYTNLPDCQDLTYQIQFFGRHDGSWPEQSTSAVLDVDV